MFIALYRSPIYAERECLQILLEYGKPIKFKNQIQGLGCNESFFDEKYEKNGKFVKKFPNCSRRIFGYRKNSLLKRKLIMKLRYRGKRTSYYSITPLGISYLCAELPELSERQASQILTNLKFFYESKPFGRNWVYEIGVEFDFSKVWDKLMKVIEERKLYDELHKVCKMVSIFPHPRGFTVTCSYLLLHTMCPIQQYLILNDDEMQKIHAEIKKVKKKNPSIISLFTDIYGVFSEFNQKQSTQNEMDMAGFQYWISLFILYALHFNLVKTHSDNFNYMLSKELENKSEVKGAKIKKIYHELNKTGLYEYDVLEVARQFANHLKSVMEQNLGELDILENTLERYQSGSDQEIPIRIETAKKSKTLSLNL